MSSDEEVTSSDEEVDEIIEEEIDDVLEDYHVHVAEAAPVRTRRYINRDREGGHNRLWNDYFRDFPTFTNDMFRRRFRMNKPLFLRIVSSIESEVPYFQQRRDATGRLGLSALQKCTAVMRILAYGSAADQIDEYLRIGETTSLICLNKFVTGIIDIFCDVYLRRANAEDIQRLLNIGESRGFPGMIGSIDCMHWQWKNCPTAWKGMYTRASGKPTIVLEAVASQDLWIWHAFFGPPGTSNDITVLDHSPVFDDIFEGRAPRVNYEVNGRQYKLAYYLTDGIYPQWATFVQSISLPQVPKHQLFAECQEACRKDVERAFGVLQARFAIVKNPALYWSQEKIGKIMKACIILHNMIVEDERDTYTHYNPLEFQIGEGGGTSNVDYSFGMGVHSNVANYMANRNDVRDKRMHQRLKNDLVEHISRKFGGTEQ